MTVDLTIVSLLERENEVNPSSLERFVVDSEVPGADLEQMHNVFGDLLDVLGHHLVHGLHLELAVAVLGHEAFLQQDVYVQKLLLSSILPKRFWYLVKAITDADNYHVWLSQFDIGVHVHGIVVLQDSSHCHLEFSFVFIVHCDANSDLGCLLFDHV